jgi:hypothetical protein
VDPELRAYLEEMRVILNREAIELLRAEMDARFKASEAVSRAAFAEVRRDIAELRARRHLN